MRRLHRGDDAEPAEAFDVLQTHHLGVLDPEAPIAVTHLRVHIYPHGGVNRLRAFGSALDTPEESEALARLNVADAEAARALLSQLRPGDEIMVASFNDQVTVLQGFTGRPEDLERSLERIGRAWRGTAIFRAIRRTLHDVRDRAGRKVVLVVSDGLDNDMDGIADYPNDPGCTATSDNDEADDCPGGAGCPASSSSTSTAARTPRRRCAGTSPTWRPLRFASG